MASKLLYMCIIYICIYVDIIIPVALEKKEARFLIDFTGKPPPKVAKWLPLTELQSPVAMKKQEPWF